ncbi:uncharacterized protein LOC117301664 [Asterias rubens]|uniref:uncharacterized protein LOC117301664 n=1 Tax=Asterias rubens TaxID=7604 RepID=UPI0014558854|nr:uncharacterized protein LOC117301664 [Asterias rubens]
MFPAPLQSTSVLLIGVVVSLVFQVTCAHICIISPRQRGPFDISHPASSTCIRHGAPCGGMPPETPTVKYIGGTTILVKFQQNLNHYEIGYPGYMDVALANNTSDDAHFDIVAVFGDMDEHAQSHQRNYTLPLTLPDIDCPHCVLRTRYIAHKPGETPFLQCSDITIQSSKSAGLVTEDIQSRSSPSFINKLLGTRSKPSVDVPTTAPSATLYGFAWNAEKSGGSMFVTVDTQTGVKAKAGSMYFGLGSGIQYGTPSPVAQSNKFVLDQIVCYGREMPYLNLIEHRNGGLDATPNKILWIDMVVKEIAGEYELQLPEEIPIVSMVPYLRQVYLTIQIKEIESNKGNFVFQYATMTYVGKYELLHVTKTPEPLYVNFLSACLNYETKMHYMLIGNENSLQKLNARIYSFDVAKRNLTKITEVDVSQYTIADIQVYEKTGELLSVSPGLFGDSYPAYTLVTLNPMDGSIKKKYEVAPAGIFRQYYGGNVINIDQTNGVLYHVLQTESFKNIIATINLNTGAVSYSGITDLTKIYNLAFY